MEPISEQRHSGSAVQLSGSVSEKRNRKRNGKPLEPVIVVSMISTMKRPKADFFIYLFINFFMGHVLDEQWLFQQECCRMLGVVLYRMCLCEVFKLRF